MDGDAGATAARLHGDAQFLGQIYRPLRTLDSITSVSVSALRRAGYTHQPAQIRRHCAILVPSPDQLADWLTGWPVTRHENKDVSR